MSVRFTVDGRVRSRHALLGGMRRSLVIAAFVGAAGAHAITAPTEPVTAPTPVVLAPTSEVQAAPPRVSPAPASATIAPTNEVRLAPAGNTIAPARVSLAPASVSLAPASISLAPAGVSPAPASVSVAPASVTLAPARVSLAPSSISLAPTGFTFAPTREVQLAPAAPPAFDAARAWAHLQKQVSFGPRPSGSAALKQCRDYIIAELKKAGLEAREQAFVAKTPAGDVPMINLVATIPGRRAERVILASHYDTKRSPAFKFVGASDAASSTAALLEIGRVLKAARQNEFTIELLFLDGEEAVNWEWRDPDNTYGSRYYVDAARKSGTLAGIKALVLLDMIGDRDLLIRRDASSTPWLVDIVWDAAGRTGHRGTFSNEITAIEDDHMHFVNAGVPSVDIIDLDYPQWHTAQDDLQHVSEKSLKIVGDVVLAALPDIEKRLSR